MYRRECAVAHIAAVKFFAAQVYVVKMNACHAQADDFVVSFDVFINLVACFFGVFVVLKAENACVAQNVAVFVKTRYRQVSATRVLAQSN